MSVIVKQRDGKLCVKCDFNRDFINEVKSLGGTWHSPYWCVPEENGEQLSILLLRIYGEDGTEQERVTVVVLLDFLKEDRANAVYRMDGKILCQRRTRDSRVQLGEDVVLLSGGFGDSGGSSSRPLVNANPKTSLRVSNVPMLLFERFKDSPGVRLYEEKPETTEAVTVRRRKIMSEISQLRERIIQLEREYVELRDK